MRLKQLMDELDKLRRYAGSDAPVVVRIHDRRWRLSDSYFLSVK